VSAGENPSVRAAVMPEKTEPARSSPGWPPTCLSGPRRKGLGGSATGRTSDRGRPFNGEYLLGPRSQERGVRDTRKDRLSSEFTTCARGKERMATAIPRYCLDSPPAPGRGTPGVFQLRWGKGKKAKGESNPKLETRGSAACGSEFIRTTRNQKT
jgi:hypothetical protein